MKKTLYPMALAFALLATSCANDDIFNINDADKDMISFSLSDGSRESRAGFLKSETSLAMRMQSDEKGGTGVRYTRTVATASVDGTNSATSYSTVEFANAYKRYWDDAYGRKGLISVYAVAVPNGGTSIKNNGNTLENLLKAGDASNTWGTVADNTIAWQVTTSAQLKDATEGTPVNNIDQEDLVYSNNIQADATLGKDGVYRWDYIAKAHKPDATGEEGKHKNGRMLFYQEAMTDANAATTAATSDPGHFDKGHLKFNHALSRMTIKIVKGEGAGAFNFATNTNIKLLKMNVKGTLNVKTGLWSDIATGDINKIAKTSSETTAEGTYVAQMLPNYTFVDDDKTNVMEFTIDNNTYYITKDMLFDALTYDKDGDGTYDSADGDGELVGSASPITMQQGKNYVFTITVNKKQIENITATLANWVDVTAANEPINNAHVSFDLLSPTGTNCTDIQFYRLAEDLGKIYTDKSYITDGKGVTYSGDYKTEGAATLTDANSDGKYETNWYFDDNKTAYHFRTLNQRAADEAGTSNTDKSENIANTATPAKSYFTMKADATTKDYHWGAPMKVGKNLAYSTTEGFKGNLHEGLISTESDIKVTELHMMSNINIVLKTSTGNDKVDLSNATISLTKLSTQATVDMGTGLITPSTTITATQGTTTPTDYWKTNPSETKAFSCSVIPQTLVRGTGTPTDDDYIGITITTNDHNQYYVVKRLSEIIATAVTDDERNQQKDQPIKYWYPNHNYTYTFTITKNGIDNITATVAKWVDVTAANKDLTLED